MSLLLLFAFLFFSTSKSQYCSTWTGIDWKTIPSANDSDVIDMYYMAAPLLYCSYLEEFTYLNGYHGGIGVVNRNTNASWTFNFDGYPSFQGSFLPNITKEVNGSHSFEWQNFGKTYIYSGINDTYWHSMKLNIATLNGTQFNSYIQWISQANTTFPYYNPWFVYYSFPDEPLLPGFECFQFSMASIQKVRELNGTILPAIKDIKVSLGTAYSWYKPVKVDFWDPKWHDKIVDFYLLLNDNWQDFGFKNFLKELFQIVFSGDFFVRNNDEYFYFEIAVPFFEMHWAKMPEPNAVNVIKAIEFKTQPLEK